MPSLKHFILASLTLSSLACLTAAPAQASTGPSLPYLTYSIVSDSHDQSGDFFQTVQFTLHNPSNSSFDFSHGFSIYETGFPGAITHFSDGPINPPPSRDSGSAAFNALTDLGDACSGAVIGHPGPRPGGDEGFEFATIVTVDPPSIADYQFYLFNSNVTPDVYDPQTGQYSFSQPLASYGPISYAQPTPAPVPEGSTLVSFGMGLSALLLFAVIRCQRVRG